jgi:DNA-binding IclR family transcriptional regulator
VFGMPNTALRKLSDATGHDASFFVQEGTRRIRLLGVMFPDAVHGAARVGESMPLDRGAVAKVMLAAVGERGPLYDEIRHKGSEFFRIPADLDCTGANSCQSKRMS